jgi:co-chaperonin GroES (HSP10)
MSDREYIEVPEKVEDFDVVANKILVRVDKRLEKVGSLFIPESDRKKLSTGTILNIGKKVDLEFYSLIVGNCVKFNRFAGWDITFSDDKNEYKVVHPDDILMCRKTKEGSK